MELQDLQGFQNLEGLYHVLINTPYSDRGKCLFICHIYTVLITQTHENF